MNDFYRHTPEEMVAKYLNQHHDKYIELVKQMLTLSTTGLALLAAFSGKTPTGDAGLYAKLAIAALSTTTAMGVLALYKIAERPLTFLSRIEQSARESQIDPQQHPEEIAPIPVRNPPSGVERFAFRMQLIAFFLAWSFLAISMIFR